MRRKDTLQFQRENSACKGGDNGVMKTEEFVEMIVEEIHSKKK